MVRRKGSVSRNVNITKKTETSYNKRRFKPGTVALREIRKLQKSVNTLIPRASLCRVIREILMQRSPRADMKIQQLALHALQEAAEFYLTTMFEEAVLCMCHAKRVTLQVGDLRLLRRLRGVMEVGNR